MIRTNRLFIRKLSSDDAEAYHEISKKDDFFLSEYTPMFITSSVYNARARIQSNAYSQFFGIFEIITNKLIGALIVYNYNPYDTTAFVDYFIAEDYRGKGYMVEALFGIIDNFKEIRYDTDILKFSVDKTNTSSIRVQEKLKSEYYDSSSDGIFYRYQKKIQS